MQGKRDAVLQRAHRIPFFQKEVSSFMYDSPAKNKPQSLLMLTMSMLAFGTIGLNWVLLFEAYRYTTVSVATLCYYMQPTIVILASVLLLHEKMTIRKAACTLAALVLSALILHERLTGAGILGALLILGSALAGEITAPSDPADGPAPTQPIEH